jgi:hypothetical protein
MEMSEERELGLLVDRLRRRYPGLPEDLIRREVDRLLHQYDGARVRTFLPILIERDVRAMLDDQRVSSESPSRAVSA